MAWSEETGIQIGVFERALGIDVQSNLSFGTLFEAKGAYLFVSAEKRDKCAERIMASWEQLALAKVKNVATFEEAKALRDYSPHGSEARKQAMTKMIELASTIVEAEKIYHDVEHRSPLAKQALAKWEELALEQVKLISTLEEGKRAYDSSPSCGEAKEQALAKWEELALAMIEQASTVSEMRMLSVSIPHCSVDLLEAKWEKLALIQIKQVSTLEEAKDLYYNTLSDGEAGEEILRKMVDIFSASP